MLVFQYAILVFIDIKERLRERSEAILLFLKNKPYTESKELCYYVLRR